MLTVPLKGDSFDTAKVGLGTSWDGGYTNDVDVDLARDSTALSFPLAESVGDGSRTKGGKCASSSSGRYCLARLGVDVRLFMTFCPGV